jgi:hypothetical protein
MMPSQGSSKPDCKPDWDPFWSQNSGDPFASSDPFNTPPTDPFASQTAVIDPFANEDITQSYTPHQGAASSGGMDLLNFSDMNVTAPQGVGSRQDKISAMMSDFSSFDTLSQPKRSNNQGHASVAASRQPSTFPNGGNAKQPAKINSDPFADLFSMWEEGKEVRSVIGDCPFIRLSFFSLFVACDIDTTTHSTTLVYYFYYFGWVKGASANVAILGANR